MLTAFTKVILIFKLITKRWIWEMVPWKLGVGPHTSKRHSRKVSMVTLWVGASPASGHQPVLSHWRNLSGNSFLTLYPGLTSKGGKGRVVKFNLLVKQWRKSTTMAKQKQIVNNLGWFISTWQGKLLQPPHMQICWKGCWTHSLKINVG